MINHRKVLALTVALTAMGWALAAPAEAQTDGRWTPYLGCWQPAGGSPDGGLLCFDLVGGRAAGEALLERLELAHMATSLGGPETLVSHPASTTHSNLSPAELETAGIGEGTVRVSVGL